MFKNPVEFSLTLLEFNNLSVQLGDITSNMCIQYRVLPQTVGDQQPSVQLGDITSSMCIQYRVLPQTVEDQQPSVQLGDIYML